MAVGTKGMSYILSIAAGAIRRYLKRVKDPDYLAFVRKFPCVACGSARRIEAAHIGPHALSEKSDDCSALPLCFSCHQDGKNALHKIGPERFQAVHGIEFAALQAMFNHFYLLRRGKFAAGWEVEQERRRAA